MKHKAWVVALVGALLVGAVGPFPASAQGSEAWKLGYQAYENQNWAEAERQFRQALEEYEQWGWLHMMLGITLYHRHQYDEALTELEQAKEMVDKDQERFQVNHALAQVYLGQGNYDQAIAAEEQAAQYASGNRQMTAMTEKTLGAAYYQQKDWRQAVQHLENAAGVRTSDAAVYSMMGRAYFELDRNQQAQDALQRAIEINADDKTGLYFLGLLYLRQRQWEDAVRVAERAVREHPQDTAIRNMLGRAYLGAKRYREAVQAFQLVVQDTQGRNDGNAHYNLGQAYQALERDAEAIEEYLTALEYLNQAQTRAECLYDLGFVYEKVGRYEDALEAFEDSAEIQSSQKVAEAIDRVRERIRRAKEGGD